MSVTGENPFSREKRGSRIVVSSKEERTIDGVVFSSKWEARCYRELRDAFVPGAFSLQPRIELQPKFVGPSGEKIRNIEYRGDFLFGPVRSYPAAPITGEHCVIDSKGQMEPIFLLKRKLFYFKYGQPIHAPRRVKDLVSLIALLKQKYPNLVRH